jgi:hypothetical protein
MTDVYENSNYLKAMRVEYYGNDDPLIVLIKTSQMLLTRVTNLEQELSKITNSINLCAKQQYNIGEE